MHIPDGFVSGPINIAGAVVAVSAVGAGAYFASRAPEGRERIVPLLAMTSAFVFAAQMLNFPIGGGTSGHFLGAAFVGAMLGGWNACLALALVLVIQCLGFADGGITALGTNIVNMGVIGGLGAYAFMRAVRPLLPAGKGWFLGTAAAAGWMSIVVAATACSLELAFSGTSPLSLVLPAMAGTHAVIGIGEALITASVLSIVTVARPELLPQWARVDVKPGGSPGRSRRAIWIIAIAGLALAFVLAAVVIPHASSSPDGLEKVAEDKGFLARAEGSSVWEKSPLPDYSVPGVESEGLSTSLAGILGTIAVFAAGFVVIRLVVGHGAKSARQPDET
ncbi:MAG: energy-coupling factor ABC transporter permease [Planctomycetota bacterium]|nr:energy-coupling factor ABC transporter permease [Planctomycetota bacterium]